MIKVLYFQRDDEAGAECIIAFDMSRAFHRIMHHLVFSFIIAVNLPNCDCFANWLICAKITFGCFFSND